MSVVLKRHHDVETVQNLPVTPKMTPNGEKPDPFSMCLLTGCVAHIYICLSGSPRAKIIIPPVL